jgi:hypothetical protein
MNARYILAGLAIVFFVLALGRITRGGPFGAARARTWLLVALIFGAVSLWLFFRR